MTSKDLKVKVAIIGAGTAGLSALKEIKKFTNDVVIIDRGPLGTTCARVGCMPSKLLIHAANQFHERVHFDEIGIRHADQLSIDIPAVLQRVRSLRDFFTSGIIRDTEALGEQLIRGEASFIDANTLQVNQQKITAESIIIATGSSVIIPQDWQAYATHILTSDTLFEQQDLPKRIGVIGAGIIGIELGQALARLGIEVTLLDGQSHVAGISDPIVNQNAIQLFKAAFPFYQNAKVKLQPGSTAESIMIKTQQKTIEADRVLACIGRKPNLQCLGLEALGIAFDEQHLPIYNNESTQLDHHPIYIVGDANKIRPLLHEAADEGFIAGYNAAQHQQRCFQRRTPIKVVFSQPNVIGVGQTFQQLNNNNIVIGEVDYSRQGRARIENQNQGILRIYADQASGKLLGAEGIMPGGEHAAHLLAWAIQQQLTAKDALQMPFYHPVIEEGMRTALRDLNRKVTHQAKAYELALCDSAPIYDNCHSDEGAQ